MQQNAPFYLKIRREVSPVPITPQRKAQNNFPSIHVSPSTKITERCHCIIFLMWTDLDLEQDGPVRAGNFSARVQLLIHSLLHCVDSSLDWLAILSCGNSTTAWRNIWSQERLRDRDGEEDLPELGSVISWTGRRWRWRWYYVQWVTVRHAGRET